MVYISTYSQLFNININSCHGSGRGDEASITLVLMTSYNIIINMQVHIILRLGHFGSEAFNNPRISGVMADVAALANDPIFLNHHAMVDCIFETWLQRIPMLGTQWMIIKFHNDINITTTLCPSFLCTSTVICLLWQISLGTTV